MDSQDAGETRRRTDTYKSRVTDQGVHPVPLRKALTSPGGASARRDPLRQPRKPRPVTGQRQEDLVQLGDKIPGKDARGEPLLATPGDVQIGLAHPDSSRQLRGPKAIPGLREEDLVHPMHDAVNLSLDAAGTIVQFDGETPPKNRLSIARRAVEGGLAHSDSSRQPRRAKPVAERGEENPVHPVYGTTNSSLDSLGNPENRRSIVQPDEEGPRKNENRPLSAAPGGLQSGLIHSYSSRQPRRPKPVVGQLEEDIVHLALNPSVDASSNPDNRRSRVQLDDEIPRRNKNHPLPVAPGAVQRGSAHSDSLRQPRRPKSIVGQREEDFVHPVHGTPSASLNAPDNLENRRSIVQLDDEGPRKNGNRPLSVAPGGLQSGSARSHSSWQPRRLRQREEDFIHPVHGTPNASLYAPDNLENRRSTVQLDDEGPRKNENRPLSVAPGVVQSGLAHSDSLRQPRRPITVVGEQEHFVYPVHGTPKASLGSPDISKNRYSTEQLDDHISHRKRNGPLPVAPDGAPRNDLVPSGSSRQPRKPKLGTEQEDFIHHAGEQEKPVDASPSNIVIIGESDVGKPSLINLIADQNIAHASNDAPWRTFQHERYHITLGRTPCTLWDTTGLDEGSEETVLANVAEKNLRELMRGLADSGGVHLIIYCIRGTRLTNALKRNYDILYVTACQKKVHVALVVTGLEHQPGEMETWWTENEAALQRNRMRFDAHACVTTLDVEDPVIQQRRLTSRTLLRGLVIGYSKLPPLKIDPSPLSRVSPLIHSILYGRPSTANPGNSKAVRKVVVCGSSTELFPATTTTTWAKSARQIRNTRYEFIRLDKRGLSAITPKALAEGEGVGAGLAIFYTSALVNNRIPPTDVDLLKKFYNIFGGQTCPTIVVLRGCDDDEAARECRDEVTSRRIGIQAYFVPLPNTDEAQAMLEELIESLCIEQVAVKKPGFLKRLSIRRK